MSGIGNRGKIVSFVGSVIVAKKNRGEIVKFKEI